MLFIRKTSETSGQSKAKSNKDRYVYLLNTD